MNKLGIKAMIRNAMQCDKIDLANKLITKHWQLLTVKQINLLNRYIRMFS